MSVEIYNHRRHYTFFGPASDGLDIIRANNLGIEAVAQERQQQMLDLRSIRKDALHTLMLQQLYALNYVWMRFEGFIQENAPGLYGSEEYYQLYQDYAAEEARRLIRTLDFPREEIGDLANYLRHSHWAIFEDIEIAELSAHSFKMRTLDCSAQRAAKRWGLDFYDCGAGGLRIRTGFFQGINPRATVRRIFTPPDPRPEGRPALASCEWLVSLDGGSSSREE